MAKTIKRIGTGVVLTAFGFVLIAGCLTAALLYIFFGQRDAGREAEAERYVTHIRGVLAERLQDQPFEYGEVTSGEVGFEKTLTYQATATYRSGDFRLQALLSSDKNMVDNHYEITAVWERESETNIALICRVNDALGGRCFSAEEYATLKAEAAEYGRESGYTVKYGNDTYATYTVSESETTLFISGEFIEDFRYSY